jgi:FlaA1/EpsC-like NDP-sugar epimerase
MGNPLRSLKCYGIIHKIEEGKNILIIGAGNAGTRLAREIASNPQL